MQSNKTTKQLIQATFLSCAFFSAQTYANDPVETDVVEDSSNQKSSLPLEDIRTFVEVFHQIKDYYVNEVSDDELLEFAIDGMLQGLDPHSNYLNQNDYASIQESTSGEFAGIGLEVTSDQGFLRIISPIDDTPAAKADIQSGDLIIKLDGQAIKGMNLNEAIDLMRGPEGSSVKLTLLREGQDKPISVTLKRAIIQLESVKSQLLDEHYGYLRIAQFQVSTGEETIEQLRDLEQKAKKAKTDIKGLIIDLRNNPGGLLQAAIEVSDTFLNEGSIVYTEGRSPDSKETFTADDQQLMANKPIVILMNQGSASASEIVAGALQDNKRALIVGTQSFGKGSVQSILPLPKERAIKLTTARYYTPLGHSIQASGITPDVKIASATAELDTSNWAIREAELKGHLENEKLQKNNLTTNQTLVEKDFQLYSALNILKAIKLSQRSL